MDDLDLFCFVEAPPFCWELSGIRMDSGCSVGSVVEVEAGLLMPKLKLAGGPTGTILLPNSTPMVTSWVFVKRPSQRRTVNCKILGSSTRKIV